MIGHIHNMISLQPIGFVRSCFKEKFGIPRQPGLAPSARGKIIIQPPFDQDAAFVGLENVSHIWVQFVFHQVTEQPWQATVRPPRLGGNRRIGVFASRSPFRPNGLGLSVVRYLGLQREQGQLCLDIAGLDLLDQTPVLDIKPYVPYVDSIRDARNEFAQEAPECRPVQFSEAASKRCSALSQRDNLDWQQLITEILQQDPRPAYHQTQTQRIYGCRLYDENIRWQVSMKVTGLVIDVIDIESVIE
jgi:tRNA (adenine37-N6)-methyltransferase